MTINLQAMNIEIFDPEISKKVAQKLLDVEAIKLLPEQPFTWASGWKSPIYCDNRMSLSFPETRTIIKEALCEMIKSKFPEVEVIAGVATAGIPQGALVADALGIPFIYVRSNPKGHGLTNQIEGRIVPGQKVVVLEDLVSTGGSSLKAVQALRQERFSVLGMAAIFTYSFTVAEENFKAEGVKLSVLSDYPTLVEIGDFSEDTKELLSAWRKNPDTWGK